MLPAALLTWMLAWGLQSSSHGVGKPAPDFSLAALNSKSPVTLSALKGKVVLIDFWASWCLPCKHLLPALTGLKIQVPRLELVTISVDENRQKALNFLNGLDAAQFKAAQDATHQTAEAYALDGMPACFLIDKHGRMRFRHDGYTAEDLDQVRDEAKQLLAEP